MVPTIIHGDVCVDKARRRHYIRWCRPSNMAMSQHFLLSAAARTLSLSAVARMSEEEAHAKFVKIRWADNQGKPYCPKCGCAKVYAFTTRKLWKCSACRYQFSVTARTIFQDRKRSISGLPDRHRRLRERRQGPRGLAPEPGSRLPIQDGLRSRAQIARSNGLRGSQPGSARAFRHGRNRRHVRWRQCEARQSRRPSALIAALPRSRPASARSWLSPARSLGRTLPFIVPRESDAVPLIRQHVASGTIIHADESNAWERLHASYDMRRVNHSAEYVSEDGASVNQAESFFSRLRRAEYGVHHRISGQYLYQYANEMAWREDQPPRSRTACNSGS